MSWATQASSNFDQFRRPILTVLLSCGAILAGLWGFDALSSLKAPPLENEPVAKVYNVEVFDVQRADLPETLVGYGTARSDREVVLSAQVAGEVIEVHPRMKVGEEVQAAGVTQDEAGRSQRHTGDVLLRINADPYQQKLEQAESKLQEDAVQRDLLEQQEQNNVRQLERAKTDIQLYEEQVDRVAKLRKQNIGAESDLTTAKLELQRYKEALIAAENEHKLFPIRKQQVERWLAMHVNDRELVRLDIAHTEVCPPFSGVLSEALVELGQHVRVGDALMKLMDLALVEVPVSLPLHGYAKLAAKVKGGDRPRVSLAENETAAERWFGHVVRVAPQADQLTRTVKVFVRVENALQSVPLLPGTFVYARIEGPVLKDAIALPRDCIVNGKVFVAEKGQVVHRPIEVRENLQSFAVIAGGLQPGDQVILTNLDVLYAAAKVRIQGRRTLEQELKQRNPWGREALAGPGAQNGATR